MLRKFWIRALVIAAFELVLMIPAALDSIRHERLMRGLGYHRGMGDDPAVTGAICALCPVVLWLMIEGVVALAKRFRSPAAAQAASDSPK